MSRKLLTAVMAVLLVGAFTLPTQADSKNERKVHPKVFDKTYGEWAAQWWKWALAGPDGENAVQDTTGEFCHVNQPKGKVWFLAGTFGGTVTRTCTIPKKKALFYPLVNSFWTDCPGTSDEDLTDAQVRAILANFTAGGDLACQLTSTLDEVAIPSKQILTVRTQSPRFTSILPENHLPDIGGCGFELPVGKTGRQIAEGYWIMLPPLSPGEHTLTLHGAGCDATTGDVFFESGVTYHLTVLDDDKDDDDDDDDKDD
jgi:hypothetical protein